MNSKVSIFDPHCSDLTWAKCHWRYTVPLPVRILEGKNCHEPFFHFGQACRCTNRNFRWNFPGSYGISLSRCTCRTDWRNPSILFGLVGYTLLIYGFGISRSLLCASLCVSAMIVPFVAIRARKVFEEKGISYMTNSIGLGLSREYALRKMILPVCFPELLGTVALGMAYGMGAVAPILYTGAVMQAGVPSKLTDPFMSLPYHLYTLVNNGFSLDYAYGTAFVLMLLLLIIQLICKFVTYMRKGN